VRLAVAVALLLRLGFGLGYWTGKPLTHDEREYLTLAVNVAQGRGFATELPGEPLAAPTHDVQRFGRGPGYPLFLAPLTVLDPDLRQGRLPGDVPNAVKIAQAILGTAALLILAGLVRRGAGERAATAAAWIGALFPPLVWMPAYALSEQLASVLALACAAWLGIATDGSPAARASRGRITAALVGAGLAAGAGALTRPAHLFFLPAAALLLVWRSPDRGAGLRRAALFSIVALATIAPWTVRNAGVHQRFVPIASSGGVNFWIGNHREAVGDGDLAANPHLKVRNAEFRARHATLSEEALEPLYYDEALGFITADPVWWLGLEARKIWYTLTPFGPSYRLHAPRYFWTSAIALLVILPAAVVGLVRAAPGTRPAALLALAAATVVVGLVFFPHERFRLPVMDPALIAAASLSASRRRDALV
jgi:4-amino-4-deoxy-L-arabinose transferase-like glycosyltransferase